MLGVRPLDGLDPLSAFVRAQAGSGDPLLEWVAWFNTQRLLEPLGYLPPAEYEERYHRASATYVAEVALT
jgi:hypothetical protein